MLQNRRRTKAFRARRPRPNTVVMPAEPGILDKILHRLANISQPALLALGIFGYFYTVVPVFQKERLEEQAAKLELEKASAEQQLSDLLARQMAVKDDIRRLQLERDKERARNLKLAYEIVIAHEREASAQQKSAAIEAQMQSQLKTLDAARWELAILDFSSAYYFYRIRAATSEFNNDREKNAGSFISTAERAWPDPLENLLAAVESAKAKGDNRNDIPPSYFANLRELILAKNQLLQCARPDFENMRRSHISDINALNPNIEAELEDYITKIRSDYEAKHQKVEITDEFRSRSRRSIRIGKEYEVDRRYRDKLSGLQKECDQKSDQIIDYIRKQKGVTR